MTIQKIKNRGIMFTEILPEWNLNLYLIIGEKHNYIIDTGLGSLSVSPIIEYIKGDNKPIVVINSHYHWDHIWGNSSFANCTIISHKLCREIIETKWDYMIQRNKAYCSGEVSLCLPILVFDNELYFPEDKIRLIYTPGHTIDCISVLDEQEKVLFVGDNIGDDLENIIPDIDCSKDVYIDTLKKYEQLDFDTCISGHNIVLTKKVISDILSKIYEV